MSVVRGGSGLRWHGLIGRQGRRDSGSNKDTGGGDRSGKQDEAVCRSLTFLGASSSLYGL
jgi:hypothetical protein